MNLTPVAIFGYNRPLHLEQTIKALAKNELSEETPLYVFIDGPKTNEDIVKVAAVHNVVKNIQGFSNINIILRDTNSGLATSIINGVTKVLNDYDSIIVLEDDLITSPYFLRYMNKALDEYKSITQVMSISGYGIKNVLENLDEPEPCDAYFATRNSSWGWGTWKDSWLLADWNVSDYEKFKCDGLQRKKFTEVGENVCLMLDLQQHDFIDSWAIRWTYTHFLNNGLSLIPYKSYVQNIGFDGSGTHCRPSDKFSVDLSSAIKDPEFPKNINVRPDTFKLFYQGQNQSLLSSIYWQIRVFIRRLGRH